MSLYGVGETFHHGFSTYNTSGVLTNADSTPTGVLVVGGTDTGATVTITTSSTGLYKIAADLAARSVGDDCFVRFSATVGGTTQVGRTPPFRVAFPGALAGGVLTQGTGAAQINTSGGAVANVTTVATTTNLTNAPTAGDLTATMKASVTTAATAATPTIASVSGAVGSVTAAVTLPTVAPNGYGPGSGLGFPAVAGSTSSAVLLTVPAATPVSNWVGRKLYHVASQTEAAIASASLSSTTATVNVGSGLPSTINVGELLVVAP